MTLARYAELLGSYFKNQHENCTFRETRREKGNDKSNEKRYYELSKTLHDKDGQRMKKEDLCPTVGDRCPWLSNDLQLFRNQFGHVYDLSKNSKALGPLDPLLLKGFGFQCCDENFLDRGNHILTNQAVWNTVRISKYQNIKTHFNWSLAQLYKTHFNWSPARFI